MSGFIYVCKFSNGIVKVGRSCVNPHGRVKVHSAMMAISGFKLIDRYVSTKHNLYCENEKSLIDFISKNGDKAGNGREWAKIEFDTVVEYAKTLDMTLTEIDNDIYRGNNRSNGWYNLLLTNTKIYALSSNVSMLFPSNKYLANAYNTGNIDLINSLVEFDETNIKCLTNLIYSIMLKANDADISVIELQGELISQFICVGLIGVIDFLLSLSDELLSDNEKSDFAITMKKVRNMLVEYYLV